MGFIYMILGGLITLVLQALIQLIFTEFAQRIRLSVKCIKAFHSVTGCLSHDPLWSGEWQITWYVTNSKTFCSKNTGSGKIYKFLKNIAIVGSGTTSSGSKIPYAFVGKLSLDGRIATGTWFDHRGGTSGYHGVFQMRVLNDRKGAKGRWAGFSETKAEVNSDSMEWERVGD